MNRGLHDLASSIKRKVAAVFAPVEPKPHRSGLLRRTLLVTAMGLFAGAAALGMVQQPDRSEIPPTRVIQSILPLTTEQVEVSTPSAAPYISETRIRAGDTLAAVLQRLELDSPDLQTFLTHDASARSIYKLYPGRSVQAATDAEGNLIWLRYIHTPGNEADGQVVTRMLHVARTDNGYKAEEITESTDRQTRVALEFINGGKTYSAVWFSADNNKTGSYYDFDGTSLRGAFLRTALKFSRISSTFGMRMHPIHKTWTGHKGVDYAAPSGTPIHSTADGTVEFSGWQNGYGNVVIIKHHGKYSTLYAHQSRIAEGITKGSKISQGQLIGYVGATGWATGPHLHYEFRVDNQPIDPLSVDLPVARALEPAEIRAFNQAVAPYKQQIQLLTEFQQTLPDALTNVASR
jgi:murein DD-endopeptidase MepM/ murein hydrolase activator NlpD